MTNKYQQLIQLPLFQGVASDKITALVEKLPFHFLKYNDGEQILAAGEPCTHVKFVVSGQVQLETPFTSLKVALYQTLSSPQVLAPDSLFGRVNNYQCSARAKGSCGILQLLKSDYIKMVSSDKVFLFNILNYLSTGSQRGASLTLAIKDGSVAEKLAMLLDLLVVNGAIDVMLRYKQKDLCTLLGTQRTTLINTLNRLADEELLDYDSNELRVLDYSRLIREIL